MDQKKITIIENAIKLFAKKGFISTSVQEIANECGISKGAFYLHFKSKDLLLYELFEYYWQRMQQRVNEITSEPMQPREKFVHQLKVTIEEVATHREFIIMQVREQAIPFNDTIETFIKRMRYHSYLFYKNHLLAIYGEAKRSYVWEASSIVQGLLKNYIDLIILDNIAVDYHKLALAIMRRVDYIMEGFEKHGDQPVISESIMRQIIPENVKYEQLEDIVDILKKIQEQESDQEILDTVEVLLEEFRKEDYRQAVIKGMASILEKHEEYMGVASQLRSYCI
ncbi:TetR family transcriptional regulator [Pontibacillus yanchengensis]|uniref:TetR family transcriptional regulator n=1 Tax=Pontibacillus yanchengensis TaxID=462910 RepID=A0ACC7VK18_9BACI|nr:TetR/AcrR family transcriptional regulator [Pontibacillus yanchengensis]MYL54494.1 TetR family transcriptional regulator [Pontibacillus yanchengensis]